MKNFKFAISAGLLIAAGAGFTACNDNLDLGPIDYSATGNYWKNVAHFESYVDGMHKNVREAAGKHFIEFGEARSSLLLSAIEGVGGDGMTLSYGGLAQQNLAEDKPQTTNFSNYYGYIANVNNFIYNLENSDIFKTDAEKEEQNYLRGVAYGLRAFYYYDLYRIYGPVPLRLTPDVINGELDVQKLYMARSSQPEVLKQIKDDLAKSLAGFGSNNNFDPIKRNGGHKKAWWSKAATECLAGDVYLWSAKVDGNTGDMAQAKQYLKNVEANYSLGLEGNFADVFSTSNKGNKEIVFAVYYDENEATNSNGSYTYSISTGSNYASSLREDGTPMGDILDVRGNGMNQSMEYDFQVFLNYDRKDSRRDATFAASYRYAPDDADHSGPLYLYDTFVGKNIGKITSGGTRSYCGDLPVYRLPWVYLALAEIANYEGNNADVEKYINLVRERAYAANWGDEYKFVAGDFTKNELAILKEKDKEFVQEGQRWWDVRRMTITKGGDALVFCPEGHINYGMKDSETATIYRNAVEGKTREIKPILNKATEAYKVLWPIDLNTLNQDALLFQTPGYATAKKPQ